MVGAAAAGGGFRAAAGAMGGSIAEAGIIVTARERTGQAFGRVTQGVGGMGGGFMKLGAILFRLLGPVFALSVALGGLAAIIASAGVVLTSKPWLEWEVAQRKAELTMRLMNVTAADQEAIFSKLDRTIGRGDAMAILGGDQQRLRNFVEAQQDPGQADFLGQVFDMAAIFDEAKRVDSSVFITAMTDFMSGDNAAILEVAAGLGIEINDAITDQLRPMDEIISEIERAAQIAADIPVTNLEKMMDEIGQIGTGLVGIFGPVGNLIAGILLPIVKLVDEVVDVIVFAVDLITLLVNGFKDLFSFDMSTGVFDANTIQQAKDVWADFASVMIGIWNIPEKIEELIISIGKTIIAPFGNILQLIIEGVMAVVIVVIGVFKLAFTDEFGNFGGRIVDILKEAAVDIWQGFFVAIQDFFIEFGPTAVRWLKEFFVDPITLAWTELTLALELAWDTLAEQLGLIFTGFKGTFWTIIDPIKEAVSWVIEKITWLIDHMPSISFPSPPKWFTNLFGTLFGGDDNGNQTAAFFNNSFTPNEEIHVVLELDGNVVAEVVVPKMRDNLILQNGAVSI